MNKMPLRMCVACRLMKCKDDLIKIVKNKNGTVEIDADSKKDGRGAYICKSKECIELAIKKRAINRAFRCEIGNEFYEQLKDYFYDE